MSVQEPKFSSVLKQGNVELRDYPAMIAAEVVVPGDQGEATRAGFRLLAAYIFGGNKTREKIAMTAPVQAEPTSETIAMTAPVTQSGSPAGWTIRFIMPPAYTMDSLPVPDDPRVTLKMLPPARFAVLRFSGLGREAEIADRTAELQAFMARQKVLAVGEPIVARYDPPWTLWFMRRNEIMIQVKQAGTEDNA